MLRKINIIGIVILSLVVSSCFHACQDNENTTTIPNEEEVKNDTSPEFKILYPDHTGWTYNQNIYEVNVRQYTKEGTFNAFTEHLPRLKEMGVGILWFMPINPIGEENRKGSLGSYYAVQDYEDVNSEFGTKTDFKNLVENVHKQGMYVILDWVANHTAWDNVLTRTHPDFYLKTESGDFQPPLGQDWTDVIQLDYKNEDLQDYMISVLKDWVIKYGVDGFRFDYVDGVPSSFWNKATDELRSLKSDIFLIAEGDGIKYNNMGFDMSYCWGLQGWDVGTLRQIWEGSKTVEDLDNFLDAEKKIFLPDKYRMYFTSNHDENSWHGTVFEQLGDAAEVSAVLTQTLYGMPLIYSGQEAALDHRLNFFEKDEISWTNLKYENLYSTLNHLRSENQALWHAEKGGLPVHLSTSKDDNIFAFARENNNDKIVVILNLSSVENTFTFNDDKVNGDYTNAFSGELFSITTSTEIELNAWGYLVLVK